MASARDTPLSRDELRERFLADHARLCELFDRLRSAIDLGDQVGTAALWNELDAEVTAHLEHEQTAVVPVLFELRPREAHGVHQEIRHVRARLREIGSTPGRPRAVAIRSFLDELEAHLRHEETLL
jgi:hypothetical protein